MVKDDRSTVTLNKESVGGEQLETDASFKLTFVKAEKEGDTPSFENVTVNGSDKYKVTDNTNGSKSITFVGNKTNFVGLKDGTYELEETVAPDGYTVVTTFTFEVKNGIVTKIIDTVTNGKADLSEDGKTLTVKDDVSTLNINKKDITNQAPLAGAKIIITLNEAAKNQAADLSKVTVENTADKSLSQTKDTITFKTTEKDVVIKGLPDGKYTLKETADNDARTFKVGDVTYDVLDSTVSFEIKDGKIVKAETTDAAGKTTETAKTPKELTAADYYFDGNQTLTVGDAQHQRITIKKTDITTEEELDGAELTIYKVERDANGKIVSETKVGETHISEKENPWTVSLTEGEYVLRETVAPDGYQLTTATEFTVGENGEL